VQGGLSQWRLLQNEVSPVHRTPHPPQFVGSFCGLMHAPLQHAVYWLQAGVHAAPPELDPELLEPLDPELVLEPPELLEPPLLVELLPPLDPELLPEPELPLDEPLPLPPSFPTFPSTEASPPPRTSVVPPQWAKTTTTASMPVAPNR
jgi:hypothetical protein